MADLEEGLELIGSAVAVTEKTTPKAAVVWGTVDQITPSIKVILDGDIDSESREVSDNAANQIEKLWNKSKHKRHLPVTVFDDFYKK